uniref:LOW QUALITY PROTEIN: major facilitator superfamily domain-containing protein 9-like n=1 Tax=Crassostrea virginica TaxID=6565 RepID=A0A8B8AK79_CRAVI|nr:LOW QUALITY PROTEIN: major facilitator superfamily domain-containing protein 9-like [Crassostrea virginica]
MPPRRPKRMKMSASKDSEQPVEPGQTPTPRSSEEAHGSVDDSPPGSTTDTLAVPTHASIPPVVPSVHSMIAANIPCYTAPSHKVMPRLIFVPPVDSRHNPTATQTGHSSRNSGDHKMLTSSDPGSNLPTHKLWVLVGQIPPSCTKRKDQPPTYPPVFLQHYLQSEFDRLLDAAVSENTHKVQKVENHKVWLVGSSILKHAQLNAFLSPGGLHLNLARGQWSDDVGRRFCLLFCLLASARGYFLMSFSTSLVLHLISRFPTEFYLYFPKGIFKHSQSVLRSYLAEVTPKVDQSGVLGTFNAASSMGFILGTIVGGRLAETSGGFYKVALACTVIFILNAVLVWTVVTEKTPCEFTSTKGTKSNDSISKPMAGEENFSVKQLIHSFRTFDWKNLWDLFLIKFCLGFSILLYRSNFSLTMNEKFEMSPSSIGNLTSYSGTIAALSGFLVGRISKLFKSDAQIVLCMAAFQALALFSLSFVNDIQLYVICFTPLSLFSTMLRVAATSLTIQRCGGKNVDEIMGMSQSVMSLARMLSPFISGVIMEVSVSGTALFGSFASCVAVIIMIFRSQEPKIYTEKKVQ